VTTGPADSSPARGRMRTSHADREQVISTLKTAFVEGRLAADEFDIRVGQALASRTHAELAAITADIPVGAVAVRAARPVLSVRSGLCLTTLAALLAAALWSAALVGGSAAAGAAALAVSGVVIFTVFVTGYQLRESRHPGRPLPPGTASLKRRRASLRAGNGSPCRVRSAGGGAGRGSLPACGAAGPCGSAGSWSARRTPGPTRR